MNFKNVTKLNKIAERDSFVAWGTYAFFHWLEKHLRQPLRDKQGLFEVHIVWETIAPIRKLVLFQKEIYFNDKELTRLSKVIFLAIFNVRNTK